MSGLMSSLKDHSEIEVIDGSTLKNFMAENLVMNYSNIELQRILFQHQNKKGMHNSPIAHPQFRKHSYSVLNAQNKLGLGQSMVISSDAQSQFHIATGLPRSNMMPGSMSLVSRNAMEEPSTNRIHFFKFDQRILTFYNIDIDKKTRELMNIDFNIPIRFCSIQTNDGRIFITGGAKNSSHSSNHAYEYRESTLAQLPNMINPREGHCLAAIGSSYIYAIGSRLYNTSKTCEVYDVAANEWRE